MGTGTVQGAKREQLPPPPPLVLVAHDFFFVHLSTKYITLSVTATEV